MRVNRGVTLIEAMLTLPVLLFLLIMLVDLMRYVTVKNALETNARQALTLATVIPGLEKPESTNGGNGEFENARSEVASRARDFSTAIFFGPAPVGARLVDPKGDVNIVAVPPMPLGAESRDAAFTVEPIRISLHARMGFFSAPGLWEIPINAEAVGFREPRIAASNPVPLDCNGNPFVPGQPLSCSCPPGKVLDPSTGECVCANCPAGQLLDPVSCACSCPAPYVPNGAQCICPPVEVARCNTRGQVINPSTCACGECPAPTVFDPNSNQCVCQAQLNPSGPCPGAGPLGPFLDVASCECRCPLNTIQQGQGCVCPPPFQLLNGQCVCPSCPSGWVPTGIGCGCECPAGTTDVNGSCMCTTNNCTPPLIQAPAPGCGCQCPSSCGANQIQNADCTCRCADGLVWDATQQTCVCPPDLCPAGTIPGGPPACGCYCPGCSGGQVLQPGPGCVCACPPGTTWNGSRCGCNACADGRMIQDPVSCGCSCPPGTTPIIEDGVLLACDAND